MQLDRQSYVEPQNMCLNCNYTLLPKFHSFWVFSLSSISHAHAHALFLSSISDLKYTHSLFLTDTQSHNHTLTHTHTHSHRHRHRHTHLLRLLLLLLRWWGRVGKGRSNRYMIKSISIFYIFYICLNSFMFQIFFSH